MNDIPDRIKADLARSSSAVKLPNFVTASTLRRIRRRRFALVLGSAVAAASVGAFSIAGVQALVAGNGANPVGPPASGDERHCPDNWRAHVNEGRGLSICTPKSWTYRDAGISGPDFPAIDLAVGTWAFPSGGECAPTKALTQVPADGAFFYAFEYPRSYLHGDRRFERRPRHFSLGKLQGPFECLGVKTYLILFQENGRYFQVHVKIGGDATKRLTREVLRSLDSLQVDATDENASPAPEPSSSYAECPVLLPDGDDPRAQVRKATRRWARKSKPDPDVQRFTITVTRAEGSPQGGCYPKKIPNGDETWDRTWIATVHWKFAKSSAGASSASLSSSTVFLGRFDTGWAVYYQFH